MSLYENINRRRKLGISRSKADSTVSTSSYSNMKKGFPKKAAAGGSVKGYNFKSGKMIKAKAGKYSKLGSSLPKKTSLMEKAGKATATLYKKLPEEGLIAKAKKAAKKVASKAKNLFKAAPAAKTGKTLSKIENIAKMKLLTGKIGKASKLAKASRLARIARVAGPVGAAVLAGEAVLKTIPFTKERKAKVAKIKARIKKQNKGKSANQMADELASPSGRSTRKIKKKSEGGYMTFSKGGFATKYYKGLV